MKVHVRRICSLPPSLAGLIDESRSEGLAFLDHLINDWRTRCNRFDREGERLLGAWVERRLVGIGGLNVDPYTDDPRTSRLRHLYVLKRFRGQGIGRLLASRLIRAARNHFDALHLRTDTAAADAFYNAIGFQRVRDNSTRTHMMKLT